MTVHSYRTIRRSNENLPHARLRLVRKAKGRVSEPGRTPRPYWADCMHESGKIIHTVRLPDNQMDRFDTMLAFTRVVELHSFTKASASLNIPKTTLSAQVHALEERLRVKLLHR